MAYIGKQPGTGVRNRFLYTATAGQTTFTTSDSNLALSYSDALYMDVYLNGVLLDPANDYTATSGTSVVLGSGATAGDVLEIVVYDVFSVFNNTINGNFDVGGDLTVDTNTLHVDSTNNRVGVGTVTPEHELVVKNTTTDPTVRIHSSTDSGASPALELMRGTNDTFGADAYGDFRVSNVAGTLRFERGVNGTTTEHMRIDSSGQVGIGTTPAEMLHVYHATANINAIIESGDANAYLAFKDSSTTGTAHVFLGASGNNMTFFSGGSSERMRLDSSGNLLVNTTSSSTTTQGVKIRSDIDAIAAIADDGTAGYFGRLNTDGDILNFRKDSATVGQIGNVSSNLFIADNNNTGLRFDGAGVDNILPCNSAGATRDNAIDLGASSGRFNDAFITNGVTTGSDQNEKQQIASLTDAEIAAAKRISNGFKTFKWNDAVAAKGDNARTHTGVIAQEVCTALEAEGLDAGNYAFFMSDTWWETQTEVPAVEADEENGIEAKDAYTRTDTYETAEEAPEGATERTRLGIRYPELLAFIGAATEQRLADIETRLTALEAE